MLFSWLKRRRRRRLLAGGVPSSWRAIVERNVRQHRNLPEEFRRRLWRKLPVFVAEKNWTGCGGLTITDEMRVTIGATACLMIVGFDDDYSFDGVQSILVYPSAYVHPDEIRSRTETGGEAVFGEAWHRGPIVLSWRHVLRAGGSRRAGHNLVVHEFAHHLDGLDGDVSGTPQLKDRRQVHDWYQVTEAEYFRLVGSAQRGEVTLLDQYGASNRAEFFAVASECFFELPGEMSRRHEALYRALREFYHLDPARWWPDAGPTSERHRARRARHKRSKDKLPPGASTPHQERPEADDTVRRPADKDNDFTCGVLYVNQERFADAEAAFSRVIADDPEDAEAYWHRALALLNVERLAEALADCDRAIALAPEESDAYRVRGFVRLAREEFALAVDDLTRALADFSGDAEAYYQRGRARAGLGHWRRAVADYSRAIRLDPYDAEMYYYRGLAYRELGKEAKAREDLEKASQLDPGAVV